jgi:ureidoglycolate lyase
MIYRQGTWHHPILALGVAARFLVQSWQDGTASDCEIVSVAPILVRESGKILTEERQ